MHKCQGLQTPWGSLLAGTMSSPVSDSCSTIKGQFLWPEKNVQGDRGTRSGAHPGLAL